MRLKRTSEGSMSISHIDMDIPQLENSPMKSRAATIKEEKVVSKKRATSAKPRQRYGYAGQLKSVNKTKQDTFMSGGKDMIYLQSEVKQSDQDLQAMNVRIAALKRNVEKTEKNRQRINREKDMTIQANRNKMEKSQGRVELAQKTQQDTERKRQMIQEERRRRSASKQRTEQEFKSKQDQTRRSATTDKQARLAKIEADKQKDYERRMNNYAKIRSYKDEVKEKKKNDETEYMGRIKHMYRKDRDMKQAQVSLNQQMLQQLQEEEAECQRKLEMAHSEHEQANFELTSIRNGQSRQSGRDDIGESQFDQMSFQQKNMSATGSKQKAQKTNKRTMIQSSTTTSLKQPANDNGFNSTIKSQQIQSTPQKSNVVQNIQPVKQQQQQQQNGPQTKPIVMNRPINKESASTQPSAILKEQMLIPKQQVDTSSNKNKSPSPAQVQQQKQPASISVSQVDRTPNAPPMKANLIIEEKSKQIQQQNFQASPAQQYPVNKKVVADPLKAQMAPQSMVVTSPPQKQQMSNGRPSNMSTPARSTQQTPQQRKEEAKIVVSSAVKKTDPNRRPSSKPSQQSNSRQQNASFVSNSSRAQAPQQQQPVRKALNASNQKAQITAQQKQQQFTTPVKQQVQQQVQPVKQQMQQPIKQQQVIKQQPATAASVNVNTAKPVQQQASANPSMKIK